MNRSQHKTMDCNEAKELFGEALDRRLARSQDLDLQTHFLSCPACRREYEAMRKLGDLTRALPKAHVSPDFSERLMKRIVSGEGAPMAILPGPTLGAQVLRVFVSGAATAAALLLAAYLVFDGLSANRGVRVRGIEPGSFAKTDARGSESGANSLIAAQGMPLQGVSTPAFFDSLVQTASTRVQETKRAITNTEPVRSPRALREAIGHKLSDIIWCSLIAEHVNAEDVEVPLETQHFLSKVRVAASQLDRGLRNEGTDFAGLREPISSFRKLELPKNLSIRIRIGTPGSKDRTVRIDLRTLAQLQASNPQTLGELFRFLNELSRQLNGLPWSPKPGEVRILQTPSKH